MVPFPDELRSAVAVVDYKPQWPAEFEVLAARLTAAIGRHALAVDHVGSTSVPGLLAKDCIDVQVRVDDLDERRLVTSMEGLSFRSRPEPWNKVEVSSGVECRKLVFAPPIGARFLQHPLPYRHGTKCSLRLALP